MIVSTQPVQRVERPETQTNKQQEKPNKPPVSGVAAGDSVTLSPAAQATAQSHNSFEANTKQVKRAEAPPPHTVDVTG